jgi:ribosomal protein S27AE
MEPLAISGTIQEYRGERYYLCGAYFQRRGVRLHRRVWRDANGDIPRGYHVHHIDGNRADNRLGNLLLFPGAQHISLHMSEPQNVQRSRQNIKKAIAAAPAWHRSEAGLAWHSEQGKRNGESRKTKQYVCERCGRSFSNKYPAKFCGNACRSAARRASGVDNESRVCAKCGESFTANRYSAKRFCGTCGRSSHG